MDETNSVQQQQQQQQQQQPKIDSSPSKDTTTLVAIIERVLLELQQRLAEAIGVNLSFAPPSELTLELTTKEKTKKVTRLSYHSNEKQDCFIQSQSKGKKIKNRKRENERERTFATSLL
jgi:hypothetical protein